MKHPGVKCAQYVAPRSTFASVDSYPHSCLQDILGARFHCAICDSVDICSNCESAGLPGNLDSPDGGHLSSHIMIKVCLLYGLSMIFVYLTSNRFLIHLKLRRFGLLHAALSIFGLAGMLRMFSLQLTRNRLPSTLRMRKQW